VPSVPDQEFGVARHPCAMPSSACLLLFVLALLRICQVRASSYNQTRNADLEERCFPRAWDTDKFTVFPDIRAEYSHKSSVGTLGQACLSSFGVTKMDGVSPTSLRDELASMERENAKRNNVSWYAALARQYVEESVNPVSQQAMDEGEVSPFEFLKVGMDIDCAVGGQIPAQAVRLDLMLNVDVGSILSSEAHLDIFQNAFVSDVATALNIDTSMVDFVEVRSLAPRRDGSDAHSPAEASVQVIFDLLRPQHKSAAAASLASKLQAQVVDARSSLRSRLWTSKIDPSSPVQQFMDDGEVSILQAAANTRGRLLAPRPAQTWDESNAATHTVVQVPALIAFVVCMRLVFVAAE